MNDFKKLSPGGEVRPFWKTSAGAVLVNLCQGIPCRAFFLITAETISKHDNATKAADWLSAKEVREEILAPSCV